MHNFGHDFGFHDPYTPVGPIWLWFWHFFVH